MVRHNWHHGTPSPYKGLEDPHETRRVSSIVLGVSADNQWVIRLAGWEKVHDVSVLVLLLVGKS